MYCDWTACSHASKLNGKSTLLEPAVEVGIKRCGKAQEMIKEERINISSKERLKDATPQCHAFILMPMGKYWIGA